MTSEADKPSGPARKPRRTKWPPIKKMVFTLVPRSMLLTDADGDDPEAMERSSEEIDRAIMKQFGLPENPAKSE